MIDRLMELIRSDKVVTAESISYKLGISKEKAKTLLEIVQDQGLIPRSGSNSCTSCSTTCGGCI